MNIVIDASNIFHRSYWMANKQGIHRDDENTTSFHTHIFLKSIKMYQDMFKPTAVYCVWDEQQEYGVKNFRYIISGGQYKSTRDKEVREKVYTDYKIVESFVSALGLINVFPFQLEGDDVIAYLSRKLSGKTTIISSDKDLLQLLNDRVDFYDVSKKTMINIDNFEQIMEIAFDDFLQYKCLIGDKADDIEKVVTPAKAKKVISGELKLAPEQLQQYMCNFELMDLRRSFDRQVGEEAKMDEYFKTLQARGSFKEFMHLCNMYQMQNIISYKESWQQSFFANNTMRNIVNILRGE